MFGKNKNADNVEVETKLCNTESQPQNEDEYMNKIIISNDYSTIRAIKQLMCEKQMTLDEARKIIEPRVKVLTEKKSKIMGNDFKYNHDPFSKQQRLSENVDIRQRYKTNKKAGIVSCPKCGSTSITTTNKKISVGKGVAGAAVGSLVNPVGTVVGAAVGATRSKKIYNVCMNCGHRWKL